MNKDIKLRFNNLKSIQRVLFILIVFTICFIWGHSMVSRPVSAGESGAFVEVLRPVFSSVGIDDSLADHIIRKCAHFIEYAGFGGEVGLLIFINHLLNTGKDKLRLNFYEHMRVVAEKVVYVALIDETIQIFSLRGSMLSDVWLDICGGLFGGSVAYCIGRICYSRI